MTDETRRTFLACERFYKVADLLFTGTWENYLILDVDSIIRKKIEFPTEDWGLFTRQYEQNPGMKVAAGVVWLTLKVLPIIEFWLWQARYIEKHWFADQILWNITYQKFKENEAYTFKQFDQTFLDWEFKSDTPIWTGKGDRKYSNECYLKEKEKWTMIS